MLLIPALCCGIPPSAPLIFKDTNCNQVKYYRFGILCQDTDDGKYYKWSGAAMVEMAAGASGDMTKAAYDADDDGLIESDVISGLDISADTNLAVTVPIVLTGDTLSCATTTESALGCILVGTGLDVSGGTVSVDVTEIPLTAAYILIGGVGNTATAVDPAGDVEISNAGATSIGADKVTEAMLRAVNAATDEDILTYESTTGDFEWHTPSEAGIVPQTAGASDHLDMSAAISGYSKACIHDTDENCLLHIGLGRCCVATDTLNYYLGNGTTADLVHKGNYVYNTSLIETANCSGGAKTITWSLGNKQKITLTADCTLTFTNPTGIPNLYLEVHQDGTGSRLVTWDSDVRWPGGTAPTLTTTLSQFDVITCVYNGSVYVCGAGLNFTP